MSLYVHCIKTTKSPLSNWHCIMNYKFILYGTFHQTLKHPMGWNILKFVRIFVFWSVTTLTLTLILCLFTNTIFEWIVLCLTSMKHIYNILNGNILKGRSKFFPPGVWSTVMVRSMEGDWSWDLMFMNQMFVDGWVFDG